MPIPNILDVMRTLRKERGYPFELARDAAIELFRDKGWPIAPSIENLYGKGYEDGKTKAD